MEILWEEEGFQFGLKRWHAHIHEVSLTIQAAVLQLLGRRACANLFEMGGGGGGGCRGWDKELNSRVFFNSVLCCDWEWPVLICVQLQAASPSQGQQPVPSIYGRLWSAREWRTGWGGHRLRRDREGSGWPVTFLLLGSRRRLDLWTSFLLCLFCSLVFVSFPFASFLPHIPSSHVCTVWCTHTLLSPTSCSFQMCTWTHTCMHPQWCTHLNTQAYMYTSVCSSHDSMFL